MLQLGASVSAVAALGRRHCCDDGDFGRALDGIWTAVAVVEAGKTEGRGSMEVEVEVE